MRQLLLILMLALSGAAFGQTLAGFNGDCTIGGEQALTNGNPSTATRQIGTTTVNAGAGVQASFPLCQVAVFATGTSNKAVLFSSNISSPPLLANPFTANTDGSYTFFIGAGCYDIVISTGTGPILPYVRTLSDVCFGGAASGAGLGGAGTAPHLGVWTGTGTLGNSTITDDTINPPTSPNGVNFVNGGGFVLLANCNPGTVLNHLATNNAGCAALNASTTSILGIAGPGAGNVGNVEVATNFTYPCVFDNQTVNGDWVIAGTPLDECHDAGASRPLTGVQIIGHVATVNAGIGTLASVIQNTGDTNSAGTASGIVGNCTTPGALAYYSVSGTSITCDPTALTDGVGDLTAVSATYTGAGAGVVGYTQGTAPATPKANTVYTAAPAAIATTFTLFWPNAVPGGTYCVHGVPSGSTVTLAFTSGDCGSGAGTVTSVATTSPITGGTITTTGTIACATCVVASSPGVGIAHFAGSTQTVTSSAVVGADMTNNTVTATQLAAQYSKGSCTEVWGGSGTSNAMQSGDDAIVNNACYNDSGVTRTITAVKCRSDNAGNTTVLTPTFGSAGTGTAILTGTLTCGNSYAYSSTGTVTNASWTTGTGIDPGMSTVGNAVSIALIIEYTF